MPQLTRRQLLNTALASAVSASLVARPAFGQGGHAAIGSTRLAEGLFLYTGAGGNVVAARGDTGVLMVDGGLVDRSPELLKVVFADTGAVPVRMLFNTHWHWDHTGSNEALAKAGAAIIAHENTRLWMGAEIDSAWEGRTYPARPRAAQPTDTFFYDTRRLSFGRGTVEYGFLPQAHTDGDIYVFFPDSNVLAAGDVVSGGRYPICDYCTGGWLGGMIAGLKTLLAKADVKTRIVPGIGPLRTRADIEAQLDMCFAVLQRISDSYYKGQTWEEFLALNPTREFDAAWGNPDLFLRTAYDGTWGHITEVRRVTR